MNTRKISAALFCAACSVSSFAYSAAADRVAPTRLRFLPNGVNITEGVVLAGQNLTVEYDPIRVAQCRGENWTVEAFLAIDGEAPLALNLIDGQGTQFPFAAARDVLMPAGKNLQIWFKASDASGCVQWDSNQNQNYSYTIQRLDDIPLLTFTARWQVLQTGQLKAGQPLRIHYDLDRATTCRTGGYHGAASWDITPKLFVDGKAVPAQTITFPLDWSRRGQQDVIVSLPEGNELTLWFENSGYEYYAGRSCLAYDSNFGSNFHFTLN